MSTDLSEPRENDFFVCLESFLFVIAYAGRGGEFELQEIYENAIFRYPEIQVGPCSEPRHSHITDYLSLPYAQSPLDAPGETLQVAVVRTVAVRMTQRNIIAESAF